MRCGVVSYHGPTARAELTSFSRASHQGDASQDHRSDAEPHHCGVEIHHDGRGHAEVSIQVEVGPGHAQSAHAVYAQDWSALAEAMAETRHRDDPATIPPRPAPARTPRRAGNESRIW